MPSGNDSCRMGCQRSVGRVESEQEEPLGDRSRVNEETAPEVHICVICGKFGCLIEQKRYSFQNQYM